MAHYSYGSGMVGCLYDNGPHFATRLRDAIDGALFIFESDDAIPVRELETARKNLRRQGIHYFSDPATAGAHYVQVSKHQGPCPKEDDQ